MSITSNLKEYKRWMFNSKNNMTILWVGIPFIVTVETMIWALIKLL